MYGKIIGINGNKTVLEFDNQHDMETLAKFTNGKVKNAELRIDDDRYITVLQRKKCYAMFHDISQWSGYSDDETKQVMKYEFVIKTGYPEFSLSDVSEQIASKFIDFMIMFCLKYDIPWKLRTWDMINNDYYFQKQCLLTRHCVICGKHGDIDHIIGTVGMGRNRKKIDNTKSLFDCLCRVHHNERHKIGFKSFILKYHIKPIELNSEQVKELNIGGYGNDSKRY